MSYYTDLRKEYLREWQLWYEMCYKCKINAKYYVEIDVCEEWQDQQGFVQFFDDMGPRPSDDHYLSRINKLEDWTPSNTIWVDGKSKACEGAKLKYFKEDFYKYRNLAKENRISYTTFWHRLRRGWNIQDAATLPTSQIKYKHRIV